MRKISIICSCKELVDVVDRKIACHTSNGALCEKSGDKYVSPMADRPDSQFNCALVAAVEVPCPRCGEHPAMGVAIVRKVDHTPGRPTWTQPPDSTVN